MLLVDADQYAVLIKSILTGSHTYIFDRMSTAPSATAQYTVQTSAEPKKYKTSPKQDNMLKSARHLVSALWWALLAMGISCSNGFSCQYVSFPASPKSGTFPTRMLGKPPGPKRVYDVTNLQASESCDNASSSSSSSNNNNSQQGQNIYPGMSQEEITNWMADFPV